MKISECKVGNIVVVNENVIPLFDKYIGIKGEIIKLMANGMIILRLDNNKECEVGGFWSGELNKAK